MSRKVLCLVFRDPVKDRELIEKAGAYAKERGVTDLILMPQEEIVYPNLPEAVQRVPKLDLPARLFLQHNDTMRISFLDLKQAEKLRPDVICENRDTIRIEAPGFYVELANMHVIQDAFDLADLDCDKLDLFVHLDEKLELRKFRDYSLLAMPAENADQEAFLLEPASRGAVVTRVDLRGEKPAEHPVFPKK